MKTVAAIIICVGVLSLAAGMVSRMLMMPLPIAPTGVEAQVLLQFANTCFLLAIALAALKLAK